MSDLSNGNLALDASTLQALNSSQKELLDAVDRLRYIGVDRFVDLPQIIVVGDQSSGKSSVLEAISRVRFPVKEDVCTRFATELVLRKAAETNIEVRIKPSPDDADHVKEELEAFTKSQFNKEELASVIEEAKTYMGMAPDHGFSKRVLIVSISGPDMPALTLVDLPGFYYTQSESQSEKGRHIVNELVTSYMKQQNSIVLAVLSAKTPLVMQRVLTETDMHDPERRRTIGIITKPDKPYSDSDLAKYIQLAKNEEKTQRLKSWHILRNRSEDQAGHSDKQRDECEREFFDEGIWKQIPEEDKGISQLVKKLGGVLLDHIDKSLPGVIGHIETHVKNRETQLISLGDPRAGPKECGRYLEGISSRFQSLVNQAVEGDYRNDEFFGNPFQTEVDLMHYDMRKLRTWICDLNRTFVAVMRAKGSARSIVWRNEQDFLSDLLPEVPAHLQDLAGLYDIEEPFSVSEDDLVEEVRLRAKTYEGQDFPGSPSSKLALKLFESESRKWQRIAARHIELTLQAVREFVHDAFLHVVGEDESTRDNILRDCVAPYFESKARELEAKVKELLPRCSRAGFMQAHVDEFNRRIAEREDRRLLRETAELMDKYSLPEGKQHALKYKEIAKLSVAVDGSTIHEFSVERVINNMVEYYGMSLRSFTENIVILAVENVLMSDIHNVFSDILGFADEKLTALAGESEKIQSKRRSLSDELTTLKKGLETCHKYRKPGLPTITAEICRLSLKRNAQSPKRRANLAAVA
ncbi:Interferon-induced GTP-binding protein Mx [Cladobotryum mycophilum]|uniref:Interferon-induced GTP-binding protein Mx n=1 Tax=Cladobotryum mycophilum TaxID=491253 RepID=A0ABR0SR53_9HYPO